MAAGSEQIAIVIPVYGPQAPVDRLLHEIPVALHPWTWIVDDCTPTPTVKPAHAPDAHLVRHPRNRGYGGSQKTGYAAAMAAGADRIVLLHGDAQYPTAPTLALADALDDAGAALGSRFIEAHGRQIPGWRRVGNRFLTEVANLRFGTRVTELHTGARAFRADVLAQLPLHAFSDDYVFDQQVLVSLLARGIPIAERSVIARYDDDVQSITFRRSVEYGLGCLWTIARGAPRG